MAGILQNDLDDPKTMGLLTLGLGLMGAPGKFSQGLSQAGQQALGVYQQASQQQKRNRALEEQQRMAQETHASQQQMVAMQLAQQRQQQEQQARAQAWAQGLQSPRQQAVQGAMAGGGGPTRANAARMPAVDPMQQMLFDGMKAGAVPVQSYIGAMQKDESPLSVAKDTVLLDRKTRAPIFSNVQPDKGTTDMQNYAAMVAGGYRGSFGEYMREQTTLKGTKVDVRVNAAKPLLNSMAEGLGKQLDDGLSTAKGASRSIATAHQLRRAAESGNIASGPGANAQVFALQLGQTLGVAGKSATERLLNTRTAVQEMAKAELDAAVLMRGQGQITQAEREIIRRAASGDISMTAPEISLLAQAIEKTARAKIKQHESAVQNLRRIPGAEGLMPFYQVEMPGEYGPEAGVDDLVRKYTGGR